MLKNYSVLTFRGDFFGGVTAGIVALPLALAFGVQSGLGAIYGLYGAMILGMIAALLGGTSTQVSGPTGPMTVVTAIIVASAIRKAGSLELGMGIIIASFMLAGLFQVALGLIQLGKAIRFIPYPVLSGFMSGIGFIIILYQVYPLMGHNAETSTIDILLNIQKPLWNINSHAFWLGLLTIAIIYLFPRLTKAIPSALVALIGVTLLSVYLDSSVTRIGLIPSGFPALQLKELYQLNWNDAWLVIEFAATLAALGAIDSLLTSVVADNVTKTKHSSNQELIGQGIGNFISGMFGGLPGAGATMRTVVNINSGGKTRVSGLIHGLVLLFILLGVGTYVSYIPLCVLAGILITVGVAIIDYRGMRDLFHVPKKDSSVLVVVLLITIFGNLLHAVGIGLVLACVLFMIQASEQAERYSTIEAIVSSGDKNTLIQQFSDKIFVKDLQGPLFFGFTARFQEMVQSLGADPEVLIIKMDRVLSIDQSGLYALEEVILDLQCKGVVVLLTDVQAQPLNRLQRIKIIPALVPEMHIFEHYKDCEAWLNDYLITNGTLLPGLRAHQGEHKISN